MNLDPDVFREALKQALASRPPFFERYHRSDPTALQWLLEWPLPSTVEELFAGIDDLPSYGKPHFCNGPVIYALLQALGTSQPGEPLIQPAEQLQGRNTLHHGLLIVKGHLSNEAHIYVTGDLTIDGNLIDWDECSRLVVLGDLLAQNLSTSGEIIVGGDLKVHDTLHAHRNHFGLYVGGIVDCRVLINNDHRIVAKSVNPQTKLDPYNPEDLLFMKETLGIDHVEDEDGQLVLDADAFHRTFCS